MLEANFWQNKSRSKKILKEKKLFEDLTNTYKHSEKNLADFKELILGLLGIILAMIFLIG